MKVVGYRAPRQLALLPYEEAIEAAFDVELWYAYALGERLVDGG